MLLEQEASSNPILTLNDRRQHKIILLSIFLPIMTRLQRRTKEFATWCELERVVWVGERIEGMPRAVIVYSKL